MPTLSIVTNLPKNQIPPNFLANASKLVSQILKTPELHVAVKIKAGQQMFWCNSDSLCGLGNLAGTGIYGLEKNKYYSSLLFDFLEKELGIPETRLYISFVEQKPSNVGIRGTTLEALIQ
ncbi:Macrophage migration inhibitory factor,Tautomerase/MIF superfamily [Cinara cedri]|uniref:L-dopachrome isomerase n=1 Tax=Cinara cedri TaxID=506608 RepID=A0A5E4M4P7_9HEMI|nr:Macrophage migration inhibitory factor,Tautomerase/MIF superfamily [Cinara cedri]